MKQTNCLLCLIGVLLLVCMFIPYETFTCQKYSTFADDTYNSLITKDMYNTIYSDSTSSSFWDSYDRRITPSFGYDDPIETNIDSLQYNCSLKGDYKGKFNIDSDGFRIAPITENKCLGYKNLGWCIEQGRMNGTCINEIDRPSKCVCGWNIGCNEEGEVDGCSSDSQTEYTPYQLYNKCKNCKRGECLIKDANFGYICDNCKRRGETEGADYCINKFGCKDVNKKDMREPREYENDCGNILY